MTAEYARVPVLCTERGRYMMADKRQLASKPQKVSVTANAAAGPAPLTTSDAAESQSYSQSPLSAQPMHLHKFSCAERKLEKTRMPGRRRFCQWEHAAGFWS